MNLQELEADLEKDGEIVVRQLEKWARTRGDRTFFYYGEEDRCLSFDEFNALANAIPAGSAESIVLIGRYDDQLVKAGGRWWFKERKIICYYSHPSGKFCPGRRE